MPVAEAWKRLRTVQRLSFVARSRAAPGCGWNGSGEGTVRVEEFDFRTTLFHESGSWTPKAGRPILFSNVFRWTLDAGVRSVRLEHLRFGTEHPVYLFDMVSAGEGEGILVSADPHVCREDYYAAWMEFDGQTIRLSWKITGPRKDETIEYLYT
jgi:hypothetical protein